MDAVYRAARITSRSDETPLAPGARPRARAAAPRPRRCLEAPARAPRGAPRRPPRPPRPPAPPRSARERGPHAAAVRPPAGLRPPPAHALLRALLRALLGAAPCAPNRMPASPTARAPAGGAAELACAACLCDVAAEVATRMACGHAFCDECWRQHLGVQIREGRSRRLVCMGVRCGAVCDEEQARPRRPATEQPSSGGASARETELTAGLQPCRDP